MKEIILKAIEKKGGLTSKRLWKKIWRSVQSKNAENEQAEDEQRAKFDQCLQEVIDEHEILVKDDGYYVNKVSSGKKRIRQEDEEDNSTSKAPKKTTDADNAGNNKWNYTEMWKNGERYWKEGILDPEYLRVNPDNITRLFCGNLNRMITEEDLKSYLPGITYIKWITDKETGEFYGSSFLEMKDATSAAKAVLLDKSKFMGRPIKLFYCPPRPTDVWPPVDGQHSQQRKPTAMTSNTMKGREKTDKPEGCKKVYIGNVSYEIDDDTIVKFFMDCGTIIGLRWLTHKETGDFRGCGYVEFEKSEDADEAMKLDGKEVLGRKIKIDWTN